MFKLSNTIAGLATLALATVPAFALTTAAHAAPAVVKVSDIDVTSAQGAQVLEQRIKVAARKVCTAPANQGGLSYRKACTDSVRDEVHDGLAARDTMTAKSQTTEIARR
ncbi:UrcA family protein [Phenylobacterium sp.]|jgi:UrcA family protein|uniref:UrcA family protein n=1 Tax=Phenylobacterium sp. TaxID=1871053 RepID=UPI0035B10028